MKLEQVVGGCDEPPLGSDRCAAAPVEAVHAAVVLGLAEHGLDHRLAAPVELPAAVGSQDAAHEGVEPPVQPGRGVLRLLVSGGMSTWLPLAIARSIWR